MEERRSQCSDAEADTSLDVTRLHVEYNSKTKVWRNYILHLYIYLITSVSTLLVPRFFGWSQLSRP